MGAVAVGLCADIRGNREANKINSMLKENGMFYCVADEIISVEQ